jgi:serine/threonine-protein kinase
LVPGLPERYIVVRKIASGGMSEVYLCRLRGEEGFEKKVAVKVIPPRLTEIARFRDLFVREARIAASLSHQNLVQVFDFGRRGNSYFLAMEFVDGWNLAQAVAQLRVRSIPIPLPLWRYWMEGMLDGIAYLHSQLSIVPRRGGKNHRLRHCPGVAPRGGKKGRMGGEVFLYVSGAGQGRGRG